MTPDIEQDDINQAAYRRLKKEIAEKFPLNRFVAIGGGQIIADTDTFEAMLLKLAEIGWNPLDVVVVKAGDMTPEFVNII